MKEIWKQHKDIDERYEFSNLGRFKNVKTQQILKPTLDENSRNFVSFLKNKNGERKRIRLARIIAEIFVPNPNPLFNIITHKDGDGLNNRCDNLKWGTVKETVDIAFENNQRTCHWEVLSNEDVISIRTEFDETDVTAFELANKYNTSVLTINSILYYKTRVRINPEKPYKVNQLKGEELQNFLNTKKIKSMENQAYRRKIKQLQKLIIDDDILIKIAYDYINTANTLKELSIKHEVSYKALKHQFKNFKFPEVSLQNGEEFKTVSDNIQISNYGRVITDGKISNSRRFNINGKIIGIRNIVGELFVPKSHPNNSLLNSIDGNVWNVHVNNLEWILPNKPQILKTKDGHVIMALYNGVMVELESIKDIIVKEYLESTEFIDFRKKYLLSHDTLFKILRPHLKQKRAGVYHCECCGEQNKRYFYKKRLSICKECLCDETKRKNATSVNKKHVAMVQYNWRVKNRVKTKLSECRSRAKIKNFDFNLDEDFIRDMFKKQNGKCAYSNMDISLDKNDNGELFSIDRIDSNKGYTKDNIALVTAYVNRMKLDWEYTDFLSVIKKIYEHNFTT